jgi:glycosyltransferase involved in cell wall biosynthesis
MTSPKRVRVLLTVPHLNRTQSPYREMMAIAKYLDRDEFDLSICALRNGGHEETGPILDRMGIPWFVAIFRPRRLAAGEAKVVWKAQREISRRGPFDIQHSLDFTSNPTEAMAAWICSRRYVYNQRNMNENGHALALRMKFRFSDRIVAIADHVREFLVEQGARPSRLVKIPNGLDLEQTDVELAKATSQPGNRILVLGQMEPRKRHQDVIRAMPAVVARHPEIRLAIAGHVYNTAYFEELRGIVEELGLQAHVEFLGPRNDVPELIRQARALVLSSESEGLPWVILEAMAARLPVVASDIAANREVVKNGRTGLLAPLGSPAGYASALNQLLGDEDLAARLTAEARAMVERRFAAEVMVRQTEGLYREMMRGARSSALNAELAAHGAK